MKESIRKISRFFLRVFFPKLYYLEENIVDIKMLGLNIERSSTGIAKVSAPASVFESKIGDYTYVSRNSQISHTTIGKFCSIGPNFLCGWGIHPINGISVSPAFYSTGKQAGISYCTETKIKEREPIVIGNDVFIGMNVTVLDGVSIGDGAIIGAGSIVSKNIPPYAIAVGAPIKVIKYRFEEPIIEKLLEIKWWETFNAEELKDIEKYFYDIDTFINKYQKKHS